MRNNLRETMDDVIQKMRSGYKARFFEVENRLVTKIYFIRQNRSGEPTWYMYEVGCDLRSGDLRALVGQIREKRPNERLKDVEQG
jgi:hypothetical protein